MLSVGFDCERGRDPAGAYGLRALRNRAAQPGSARKVPDGSEVWVLEREARILARYAIGE